MLALPFAQQGLTESSGETRLEHSPQRRPSHLCNHLPPLTHQYRFYRRIQRNRIPSCQRSTCNLHDLIRLSHYSPRLRRTSSTPPLEFGPLGYLHQHRCCSLSDGRLGLHFLPRCDSCHASDDELECGYVCGDDGVCDCLLPDCGEKDVSISRGSCEKAIGFYLLKNLAATFIFWRLVIAYHQPMLIESFNIIDKFSPILKCQIQHNRKPRLQPPNSLISTRMSQRPTDPAPPNSFSTKSLPTTSGAIHGVSKRGKSKLRLARRVIFS